MMLLAQETVSSGDSYLLWGFILFAAAVGLLVLELFVPSGGLIGALAGIAAIGSIFAFFRYDTLWGAVATGLYVVLTPIALVYGFKLWLNSPIAKAFILAKDVANQDTMTEQDASEADHARRERLAALRELIGAEGVSITALRPVGTVKIADHRLDALAETGVIAANTPVVVTDVYDNQIKVRPR